MVILRDSCRALFCSDSLASWYGPKEVPPVNLHTSVEADDGRLAFHILRCPIGQGARIGLCACVCYRIRPEEYAHISISAPGCKRKSYARECMCTHTHPCMHVPSQPLPPHPYSNVSFSRHVELTPVPRQLRNCDLLLLRFVWEEGREEDDKKTNLSICMTGTKESYDQSQTQAWPIEGHFHKQPTSRP